MKHLFFVAVATGVFAGTTLTGFAQSRAGGQPAPKTSPASPRFIESIEIFPAAVKSGVIEQVLVREPVIASPVNSTPASGTAIETCSPLQFKYAMLMNREVETISNASLYQFIDQWWGTRYQYGGLDSNGIDCSAFTAKLFLEVYHQTIPRVAKDQYKYCEKVDPEALAEGDLVFFNTRGGVSHVGLYLGNQYFVHASAHDGITISSLTDDYYSRKFISGGRVKADAVLPAE